LPRTIELGTYLGIRDADGALIAMAGERMHPQGWTEISAVCTAPEARGRGLASRLIRAVGHGIRERGDVPFLHTSDDNPAQKLYDAMG
ncbi:GNAT family N-acetyltransferase, partial [Mycobacterium kansasii]